MEREVSRTKREERRNFSVELTRLEMETRARHHRRRRRRKRRRGRRRRKREWREGGRERIRRGR